MEHVERAFLEGKHLLDLAAMHRNLSLFYTRQRLLYLCKVDPAQMHVFHGQVFLDGVLLFLFAVLGMEPTILCKHSSSY